MKLARQTLRLIDSSEKGADANFTFSIIDLIRANNRNRKNTNLFSGIKNDSNN